MKASLARKLQILMGGVLLTGAVAAWGCSPPMTRKDGTSEDDSWSTAPIPASGTTKTELGVDSWKADASKSTVQGYDANGNKVVDVKHDVSVNDKGEEVHSFGIRQGENEAVSRYAVVEEGGKVILKLLEDFLKVGSDEDGGGGLFDPKKIAELMKSDFFKQGTEAFTGLLGMMGQGGKGGSGGSSSGGSSSSSGGSSSGNAPQLTKGSPQLTSEDCPCVKRSDANVVQNGLACQIAASQGSTPQQCGDKSVECPAETSTCANGSVPSIPFLGL